MRFEYHRRYDPKRCEAPALHNLTTPLLSAIDASVTTDLTCRVFAGKFERWRCWRNVEDVYLRRVRRLASPQIFFDANPPV